MCSSRGFASTAANIVRPVRTRFRFGSGAEHLNPLTTVSRRIIMQKARRHPWGLPPGRAPTACRHVVSGSLSSPGRGSSHRSLALLGSLSVAREYLALRDGPRSFGPDFTCLALLRCRLVCFPLPRTGLSPPVVAHSRALPLRYRQTKCRSYNPARACPDGLGWSAFARRY
jgi:hypothetical protein